MILCLLSPHQTIKPSFRNMPSVFLTLSCWKCARQNCYTSFWWQGQTEETLLPFSVNMMMGACSWADAFLTKKKKNSFLKVALNVNLLNSNPMTLFIWLDSFCVLLRIFIRSPSYLSYFCGSQFLADFNLVHPGSIRLKLAMGSYHVCTSNFLPYGFSDITSWDTALYSQICTSEIY